MSLSTGATTIEIPPGTVCVECIINGELDTDAMFQLDGSNIDSSKGVEMNGVLVLFQTENVFVPNDNPTLRCFSSSGSTQALVLFVSKSYTSHDLAVLILALVPLQFSGLPLSLERLLSMKEVIWTWIVMQITQAHFPVYSGSTLRE